MDDYTIKAGNCFKLIPYKHLYMVVADEHFGNVCYHVVNLEHGIVTCTYNNVQGVIDFLKRWKAVSVPKLQLPPQQEMASELQ